MLNYTILNESKVLKKSRQHLFPGAPEVLLPVWEANRLQLECFPCVGKGNFGQTLQAFSTVLLESSSTSDRIIEVLRLEKTYKILESSIDHPIIKPCMSPSVTSTWTLNTSGDSDCTTVLGSLLQCFTTISVKKFFPVYPF